MKNPGQKYQHRLFGALSIGQPGFTLVELMIALLIGGIVLAAIMTSFRGQHATYLSQDQVVEMQQNIRVAMNVMARDIRYAGFDPNENLGAKISTAKEDELVFSRARDDDHEQLEFIRYQLYTAYSGTDRARSALGLSRNDSLAGLTNMAVAEHIEKLEFYYIMDGSRSLNPASSELDEIQGVEISMLARAANEDRRYTDTKTYETASGVKLGPYNDGYRRRLHIFSVNFRNMLGD